MARALLALALAIVLAGCSTILDATLNPRALGTPSQLSCPPPCAIPVDASEATAGEPMVAVNPSDPDHLVAGSVEFGTDAAGNAYFWMRAHVSQDGGKTWESRRLPGGPSAGPTHPLAPYTSMGDPVVVILQDGTVVYSGLVARDVQRYAAAGGAVIADIALFVARSTDGGLTYPEIVVVAEGRGAFGFAYAGPVGAPLFTPMDMQDKQFMARGPDGTLLLTWTNFEIPAQGRPGRLGAADILFSTSTDGGRTWSAPAPVAHGNFQGSFPAIAADGTFYAAFLRLFVLGDPRDGETTDLVLATSKDRGKTWTTSVVGPAVPQNFPSLRAHRTPGGGERLLLAFAHPHEEGKAIPALTTSRDGGATWAEPLRFDTPEARGKPLPVVDVDGRGVAYVGYYHPLSEDGDMEFRVAAWDGEGVLGPITVSPDATRPGFYQRDYAGLAGLPEGAFAVWVGGREPETDVQGARVALV